MTIAAYHSSHTGDLKTGEGGTFFLSEKPGSEEANYFGAQSQKRQISFKNPLVLGKGVDAARSLFSPEEFAKLMERFKKQGDYPLDAAIARKAKELGHDGIVYHGAGGATEYVVLDPRTLR